MGDKMHQTIKNKIIIITLLITVIIISVLLRLKGIYFESIDMTKCLYNWFDFLKNNGGLSALKYEIGDYNIPYMTILAILSYIPAKPIVLIKAVSIIFDYLLAISCVKLVKEILKEKYDERIGILVFSIIVLLPTVILNSSYWGQCDSIYTTFIIISLIYLIREKYLTSFIFLGVSFAFKLQFIFILPLYVLYFLGKRKFSIYYFIIIPIVNLLMCTPAMLLGKNVLECIKIYFNQTSEYNYKISLNFPGIYNLFYDTDEFSDIITPNNYLPQIMILVLAIIFIGTAVYVLIKQTNFDSKNIIEIALWSVIISTFLLPYMHDRYMFMADILSIIYCVINGRKKVYIPIIINLCSTYTYIVFLSRTKILFDNEIKIFALMNCVIVGILTASMFKNLNQILKKENKKAIA